MTCRNRSMAVLFCGALLGIAASKNAAAHDDDHGESNETVDRVVVQQDNRTLVFRMAPQCTLEGASPAAACTCQKPEGSGAARARVGNLAFLIADLTENDQPVANVHYTLTFHHIEDDKEVFSTRFVSPEGTVQWGQQFFDGADHRVTLTATSTGGSFEPITAEMIIGVEAIQPPGHIIARTLGLFLALTAGMMVVGYVGAHWFIARRMAAASTREIEGAEA